jgi:hypothetical protein
MYGNPRTFRCPNCNEMIHDQMANCRFCDVAIDPGIAALVAGRQEKANRAYSDASYLRATTTAMFLFLAVGLVLTIAYAGFVATFIISIVLLVRWQVEFGNLLTNDPDYSKAKRFRNISAFLLLLATPLGIIASPFIDVVIEIVEDLLYQIR